MAHLVRMLRSGHQFEVEAGETILAAGLRQGLALPFGCQSGNCASCRVRVADGRIEYPAADSPRPAALSDAEAAAGYVLMCRARACSDLTLDLHQPAGFEMLRPRQWPARVAGHRALSHDVIELRVKLPQPLRFLPGQYVDFLLPDKKRRSFSIANADADDSILEFHLRVTPGGKFAHYVRDEMPARTLLRLEGPLGAFYLREDSSRPVILMAGGTGFAPLKAMIERAVRSTSAGNKEQNAAAQLAGGAARPLHLFWGARSERDIYLPELPRRWAAAHARFSYTPVLSEPPVDWPGERGFVHEAVLRRYPNLAAHEVYMAGPPAMVHAAKRAFATAGLDADHLFYDSFDYAFETWPGLE